MEASTRIEFPEPGFEALIFDLDGTLVDSMPAHFEAWCEALAGFGAAGIFEEDVFYAMGGRPTKDIVGVLNGENGLRLDPDAVSLTKREAFLRNLSKVELHGGMDIPDQVFADARLVISNGEIVAEGRQVQANGTDFSLVSYLDPEVYGVEKLAGSNIQVVFQLRRSGAMGTAYARNWDVKLIYLEPKT